MVEAERFLSKNRIATLLLILGFAVACARSAPEVPPDYGSRGAENALSAKSFSVGQLRLTCAEIADEQLRLDNAIATNEAIIHGKRTRNQVSGLLGGVIFAPALLALDNTAVAKRKIDELQAQRDQLVLLKRYRNCTET